MDMKDSTSEGIQTNAPTKHEVETQEVTAAPRDGQLPSLGDWVSNYTDLLATELYHRELRYQSSSQSKDGDCRMPQLTNCSLEEFSSDRSGKTIVRFSTKNHDGFSKGDPVSVRNGDIAGAGLMHGIIYSLADNSVEVYLNQTCGYLDEDGSYSIVKVEDSTTHYRMRDAVQKLPHLEHPLVKLLFGEGQLTQQLLELSAIKFFNEGLTDDQKEAVLFALSMNELAVIHGPPGTGKTTTLVEIILQLTRMGKKVLVCAPTNVAVDNLLDALVRHEHLGVVRLGHPARSGLRSCLLDSALASHKEVSGLRKEQRRMEAKLTRGSGRANDALLRDVKQHRRLLREQEQVATREIVRACNVVACTLLSACDTALEGLSQGHFDVVVIDENSQAMEGASWVAVPRARKVILAGDHMQLPPTVHSPLPCDLEVSLMERAVSILGERCHRTLSMQHRMNCDIMRWVSDLAYEGRLSAHPAVAHHLLCDLDGVQVVEDTETPLLLVDTAGCRLAEEGVMSSQQNLGEARIVGEVVERLLAAGVPQQAIGIITPYKQQVWLMKRLLWTVGPGVEVRTVDGYQGREKEAVVLSMVRSNQEGELGFTADRRRLNVAVSRARRLLCVVADTTTLSTCEMYRSLFAHVRAHGVVHNAHQYESVIPQHGQASTAKSSHRNKGARVARWGQTPGQGAGVDVHLEVLRQFVENREMSVWRFPCELSSYARMRLHSECERLGLKHYSEGVADQRHLVVEKLPDSSSLGDDPGRKVPEGVTDQQHLVVEKLPDSSSSGDDSSRTVPEGVTDQCSMVMEKLRDSSSPGDDPGRTVPEGVTDQCSMVIEKLPDSSSPGDDPGRTVPEGVTDQRSMVMEKLPDGSFPGDDPGRTVPEDVTDQRSMVVEKLPDSSYSGDDPSRTVPEGVTDQRSMVVEKLPDSSSPGDDPSCTVPEGITDQCSIVMEKLPNSSSPGDDPGRTVPEGITDQRSMVVEKLLDSSSPGDDPSCTVPEGITDQCSMVMGKLPDSSSTGDDPGRTVPEGVTDQRSMVMEKLPDGSFPGDDPGRTVPEGVTDQRSMVVEKLPDSSSSGDDPSRTVPEGVTDQHSMVVEKLPDSSSPGDDPSCTVPEGITDQCSMVMEKLPDISSPGDDPGRTVPEGVTDQRSMVVEKLPDSSSTGNDPSRIVPEGVSDQRSLVMEKLPDSSSLGDDPGRTVPEGVSDQRHLVMENIPDSSSLREDPGLKVPEGVPNQRSLVVEKLPDSSLLDDPDHKVSEVSDDQGLGLPENFGTPKDDRLSFQLDKVGPCAEDSPCGNNCSDPCATNESPSGVGDKNMDSKTKRSDSSAKTASNSKRRHRGQDDGAGWQEETDDEVLRRFQQDARTCGQDGCGKNTELFGQLCQHCRRTYCLGHCLPEVHGCTEEARAHARSTFLRPPPRPADPIKRGFAERKLKAKLGDMAHKRKPKKK